MPSVSTAPGPRREAAASMADTQVKRTLGLRNRLVRFDTRLLALVGLAFILFCIIYPLALLGHRSVTEDPGGLYWFQSFFESSAFRKSLVTTFKISILVTGIALVLAYPYSWALVISNGATRAFLLFALLLPLLTSILIRTYGWLVILDPHGLVNNVLTGLGLIGEPLQLNYNLFGVTVGMVHYVMPFMVLPMYAVNRNVDLSLYRAALSLGATPLAAVRTIIVPLSLGGVASGTAVVFIISVGFFVTPAILGGSSETMLAQLIYSRFSSLLQWGLGSAMSMILIMATFALFVPLNHLFTRGARAK